MRRGEVGFETGRRRELARATLATNNISLFFRPLLLLAQDTYEADPMDTLLHTGRHVYQSETLGTVPQQDQRLDRSSDEQPKAAGLSSSSKPVASRLDHRRPHVYTDTIGQMIKTSTGIHTDSLEHDDMLALLSSV